MSVQHQQPHARKMTTPSWLVGGLLSAPGVAFAQPPSTFSELVGLLIGIINTLIPLMFAVLFVYFMWKVFDSWVLNAGDPTKQAAGRQYAVAAVITLVVIISTWGIVRLLQQSIFG